MDSENTYTNLDKYGHEVGESWTVKEIAAAVDVSPGRIRQLLVDGTIKSYLRTNRLRMIKYYDGLAYIESRKGKSR